MQAFEGIRVVDFTHVLAGPFCTYQLAVMGADVIKIEPPHEPDMMRAEGHSASLAIEGRNTQFLCQNGNKRSLCLDLNHDSGKAIARRLVESADVLVENYRGGVLDGQGFGYDAAAKINPNLIYCSLTGFGRTGPKAKHPAYDNVIQAFSGLMAATGTPSEQPVRVGPAVLDYGTGAQAAFAIASALFQRTRSKRGQRIDVAMTDAALMLMSTHIMDTQMLGRTPPPYGNRNPHRAGYALYETSDGKLMIGAFTRKQNQRLWRTLGRDDIADEIESYDGEDFKNAADDQSQLLASLLLNRSAADWESELMQAGVPAARVRRIDECIEHPQIESRGVLSHIDLEHGDAARLKSPVAAFGYDHDGPAMRSPAPRLGEHSAEVLAELGYSETDIATLCEQGVVSRHA